MSWAAAREAKRRLSTVAAAAEAGGDRKLMTLAAAEREFGPSRRTLGRMIERGQLTPITVGKRVRVARIELLRVFAGLAQ